MTCAVISGPYCAFRGGAYHGDGSACASSGCAQAWVESGDAGDLPATAQTVTGSGPIPGITGVLTSRDDVDMFKIQICDAAAFSADAINAATTFADTQLFLFDSDGYGIAFDDDDPQLSGYQSHLSSQWVPGNGVYFVAISGWDQDPRGNVSGGEIWNDGPYNEERRPDGPAAGEQVGSWDTGGYYLGYYLITLTGACCLPGAACYANCDGGTTPPILNVNDFVCFQQRFAAGCP
jgi:hypothetical protein